LQRFAAMWSLDGESDAEQTTDHIVHAVETQIRIRSSRVLVKAEPRRECMAPPIFFRLGA
jgi:hypothetical protein